MPVDMTITTDTIETDPSTLDAVDKALFDNIDKPVSDEIKGNMVALRAAAAHYISVVEDLNKKLEDFKEELFNLRIQKVRNRLENTSRIRVVRRDIARVLTLLTQKKLAK